jgi:hypothetical protein
MGRNFSLDESEIIERSGIADSRFADHSGDIQHGYQLGSLTEGLVAYYPMEEGQGQVLHDGALDNLGQINGATWNGSGQVGSNALDFDGSNDNVNTSGHLFSEAGFSVGGWVNLDSLAPSNDDYVIFENLGSGGSGSGGFLRANRSAIEAAQFGFENGSSFQTVNGISTISTDSWVHIFGVYDGSEVRLYIDASLDNSVSASGEPNANGNEGSIGYLRSGSSEYLNGQIDDLRVYSRPLSQPEIEALAGLTEPSGSQVEERDLPTYPDPEAIARYEFENDVTDSWGSNDATDNTSAGFVDGVYGQAKDFDGSDDYVDTNIATLNTPTTISAWFNLDNTTSSGGIISNFTGGDDDHYIDYNRNGNNEIRFTSDVGDGRSLASIQREGTITDSDRWYQVVGVLGRKEMALYLDGNIVGVTGGTPDGTLIDSGHNFWIGWMNNEYHNGKIDDVRIYDRALDPIEVETLFNKGAYRINRGEL